MTAPLDPPTHWYRRSSATDRTQTFVRKLPGDPIAHLRDRKRTDGELLYNWIERTERFTAENTMQISRHDNGLGPKPTVSSVEEGSPIRHYAQLHPIDISRLNEDESEIPKSLFDEFLLLFVRSS